MADTKFGDEIEALKKVLTALEPLDETQQAFVLRTASSRLSVPVEVGVGSSVGSNGSGAAAAASVKNPGQFMTGKKPSNDVERATCLAFLLKQEGAAHFKGNELLAMNRRAAGKDFSNVSFTVRNARVAGYLAKAGGGKNQISPLGELIVEALPDTARVTAVLAENKTSRRPRGKKKGGK